MADDTLNPAGWRAFLSLWWEKDGWYECNSSVRAEDSLLYCLNDMLWWENNSLPPWIICTWKGIFIRRRGDGGTKLFSVYLCVLLTSSVCSISTGEYGGGPSMPHGASCKMSGVGRQIWRDTMKWTPSSLAWTPFRDNRDQTLVPNDTETISILSSSPLLCLPGILRLQPFQS